MRRRRKDFFHINVKKIYLFFSNYGIYKNILFPWHFCKIRWHFHDFSRKNKIPWHFHDIPWQKYFSRFSMTCLNPEYISIPRINFVSLCILIKIVGRVVQKCAWAVKDIGWIVQKLVHNFWWVDQYDQYLFGWVGFSVSDPDTCTVIKVLRV